MPKTKIVKKNQKTCTKLLKDSPSMSTQMSKNDNLGDKKNGGFLKQILSTSIKEKLIKIGDG